MGQFLIKNSNKQFFSFFSALSLIHIWESQNQANKILHIGHLFNEKYKNKTLRFCSKKYLCIIFINCQEDSQRHQYTQDKF